MTGPLAQVRIIDLSNLLAGQYCARILADLGAEVIKIEAAPTGDPMRGHDAGDRRWRHLFSYANAGKKSFMLDPGSPETFPIVAQLVQRADVVVEDFLPGIGQDWAVAYPDLQKQNGRLVVCSITPFGRTGPRQGELATEAMIQGLAGTAFMTGPPGGPPYLTANGFPHTMTASHACIAIIQALLDRERTGRGQSVDVAMLDTVVAMDCENIPFVAAERGRYTPLAFGHAAFADTLALYHAKDGYIVIEVWGQGRASMWGRLAQAMGREDLLADPRFVGDSERVTHLDELRPIVEQWLRSFPTDDAALEALVSNKVVSGRVLAPWQTMDLPQVATRSMIREVASAAGSRIAVTATPYKFSATPITVGNPPRLGEHNSEILQSLDKANQRGVKATVAPKHKAATSQARIEPTDRPGTGERLVVLDFTSAVAGPYATRILADLGAEIIKIERPPAGDVIRTYAPPGIEAGPAFAYTSSGKKSLCIDVAAPEGRAIIEALVPFVDIVIQNFTPGTMEKLGLDYEKLRSLNPALIMCSVSGFGQDGPWRELRATDPAMQGWTGIASMIGEPDAAPYLDRTAPCDTMTATQAALAMNGALFHRARTGVGQHIDVSLMDTVLAMDSVIFPAVVASSGSFRPERAGRFHPLGDVAIVRGPGHYFVVELSGSGPSSSWGRIADVIGHPELVTEARFEDDASRLRHRGELLRLLDGWLSDLADDDMAVAALARGGLLGAPILTPLETISQPQVMARAIIRDVPQPDGSVLKTPATPYHLSDRPIIVGAAPTVGEHNEEILRTYLAYTDERILDLFDRGLLFREGSANKC